MTTLLIIALMPLNGCYSLLVVNLGVVNKSAAANGAPLDPEVACAALAPFRLKVDSKNRVQPDVETNWARHCQQVLAQQQQKARETK